MKEKFTRSFSAPHPLPSHVQEEEEEEEESLEASPDCCECTEQQQPLVESSILKWLKTDFKFTGSEKQVDLQKLQHGRNFFTLIRFY